jgi:hypothetical protein
MYMKIKHIVYISQDVSVLYYNTVQPALREDWAY